MLYNLYTYVFYKICVIIPVIFSEKMLLTLLIELDTQFFSCPRRR